jgi:hypothetical protein
MPPSVGHKKRIEIVEKSEKELEQEIKNAAAAAEEKFSQVRPMPTDDQLLETMNTHSIRRNKRDGSTGMRNFKPTNLPDMIKAMPDSPEKKERIKAAAQAALLMGESPAAVSTQYGIPYAAASNWSLTVATANAVGRRDRLTDMIMLYIEQEFKSLIAISIATADERWIRRQDADSLAHFIAVKSDRLMLLLQALGRAESSRAKYVDQLQAVIPDHG